MSLRLRCLIEGEDIVFPVNAVFDDEVSDLKDKIKKKCAVTLEGVDAHHLELWKPKELDSIAAKPSNTLIQRIRLLDFSNFTDKLEPADSVFSIFPTEPPRDYIHIIVKVLHTSE
ncbi:hypothetical protein K443DRAFT_495753 [Laccaria amethystina LaAM-08-1]|uniref:Crinkler effector protein N-terminal domain-containing protein n=1 Tax=Laccaria amethystina LaAM-08-1 TaxID=1095629 RepID=A0A0C9YLH4_9AGAR|nr:hypothetical protein K443DRAFT_495753 [Laccaria amethystina LaAM-08-1]